MVAKGRKLNEPRAKIERNINAENIKVHAWFLRVSFCSSEWSEGGEVERAGKGEG